MKMNWNKLSEDFKLECTYFREVSYVTNGKYWLRISPDEVVEWFKDRINKEMMQQMNDYALWFVKNFDDLYDLTFEEVYIKWKNENKLG